MADPKFITFDAIIDDEKDKDIAQVEQPAFIVRGNGSIKAGSDSKEAAYGTFEWYSVNRLLSFRLTSCEVENKEFDSIKLISSVKFPGEVNKTKCSSLGFYLDTNSTRPVILNCSIEKENLNTLILTSVNEKEKLTLAAIRAILNKWFFLQLD